MDVRWPGNQRTPVAAPTPLSTLATSVAPSEWDASDDRKIEQQLAASIAQARNGTAAARAATPAAELSATSRTTTPKQAAPTGNNHHESNGNGTGNGTGRSPGPASLPPIPLKIPMDLAFNEILTWMKAGLEAHHIQWNDAAQQ